MKNKYKLTLIGNRFHPAGEIELEAERILCNNIILPNDRFNPHSVKLWVIGNEFGAMGAVWADCEQDALDELVDNDLGGGILIDEDKDASDAEREEWAHLGNAGEAADLTHCWMNVVSFEPVRDLDLLLAFAEAKGANVDNLDEIN